MFHKKQLFYGFIVSTSTSASAYQSALTWMAQMNELFTHCGCCGYVFYVNYLAFGRDSGFLTD